MQASSRPPTLDSMPRAFDASSDAGDDYSEVYHNRNGPSDDEAVALAGMQLPEREDDGGVLLGDRGDGAFGELPCDREAHQAGDAADRRQNRDYVAELQKRVDRVNGLEELDDEVSDDDAARLENSSEPTESVITESVHESLEAGGEWAFEQGVELLADVVHPGLGRLVSIAFKVKEILGDAEALATPDSPCNLHVPLLHITGTLSVDLNVHLQGSDGTGDDALPLTGFLSPGDDGLFGGWGIELERPSGSGKEEASASGRDARPDAEQAGRSRSQEPPAPPVIESDLSVVKRRVKEPWRRAVVLREAASRLRTRLFVRPEFAAQPILVIYDPLAGLGMWLVGPDIADGLAGRQIEIWTDLATGATIVSVE